MHLHVSMLANVGPYTMGYDILLGRGGGGYFVGNGVMGARWSRRGVGVPQECGTVPVAKVFG